MKHRPLIFSEIPAWTYSDKKPSHYTFYESIRLAGLEGKWIRLDSATQMRLLGFPIFGKQLFIVHNDGAIGVTRSAGFGRDFESTVVFNFDLIAAVEGRKFIRPGYIGQNIYSRTTAVQDELYAEEGARQRGFDGRRIQQDWTVIADQKEDERHEECMEIIAHSH